MSLQSRARQRPTIGWKRTLRGVKPEKLPPFNVTEFQDQAHKATQWAKENK